MIKCSFHLQDFALTNDKVVITGSYPTTLKLKRSVQQKVKLKANIKVGRDPDPSPDPGSSQDEGHGQTLGHSLTPSQGHKVPGQDLSQGQLVQGPDHTGPEANQIHSLGLNIDPEVGQGQGQRVDQEFGAWCLRQTLMKG